MSVKLKYISVFVVHLPSPEDHLTLQFIEKFSSFNLFLSSCTSLTSNLGIELSDLPVVFQPGKWTLEFPHLSPASDLLWGFISNDGFHEGST